MGERKLCPALRLRSSDCQSLGASRSDPQTPSASQADQVSATVDDFSPVAIQDLADPPLPAGSLWDPTLPPPSDVPSTQLNWRVFFASSQDRDAAAAAVEIAHPDLTVASEDFEDDNWAARSQRSLSAIRAGTFIVAPPWDVPSEIGAGTIVVIITPSRGFGTGHHASTRVCLRALSGTDVRGRRVLDVGTGSGVLAMAAALSGAEEVTAIDIDPDAIEAARDSAALNQRVLTVEWLVGDFRGDASPLGHRHWDIVLANLTGGMLISSARWIRELMGSTGLLLVSGFDEHERAGVEAALEMTPRATFTEEGWVGLVLSR